MTIIMIAIINFIFIDLEIVAFIYHTNNEKS